MEIVEFNIIPKNSPDLCGKCFTEGDNCFCDCHKEPIFAGYHYYCYSIENNIPLFTKKEAKARGIVCHTQKDSIIKIKRFFKRLREIF